MAAPPRQNIAVVIEKKPRSTPELAEQKVKMEEAEQKQPGVVDVEEDDIGEVQPDHYYEGGKVPVFKPVCFPTVWDLTASPGS
jgi:hypothetical protein